MENERIDQTGEPAANDPKIIMNEYGSTKDEAVVVEEKDRTVLLTHDETVVMEKEARIDIVPKNRPRKVYGGMWGQTEVATVGLALLAVLAVILFYFFMVVPSNAELEAARSQRDRLETELASATAKYGDITNVEGRVASLVSSVSDFEARYLPVAATGRTNLYQRINSLIAAYGLLNTSGPDFSPLETIEEGDNNQSDQERGRSKFRSLYPGVYATMTVEGTYHNLRRFIRDIETGSDFIIVSAVELEPSDSERKQPESNNPPPAEQQMTQSFPSMGNPTQGMPGYPPGTGQQMQPPQYPRPKGKTHGEIVSLRIEMAAYFRRPNMTVTDPAALTPASY